MKRLHKKLRRKPHLVLTVPAVLSFIMFVIDFVRAIENWKIDSEDMHRLMKSADGFETVILVITMFILKHKKK